MAARIGKKPARYGAPGPPANDFLEFSSGCRAERLPVTATSTRLADAFLRAAIRSPANELSSACDSGPSRLPRRKSLTRLLLRRRSRRLRVRWRLSRTGLAPRGTPDCLRRSEEHPSELQSVRHP